MSKIAKFSLGTIAAASALVAGMSVALAAEEEKPKFTYSFNVGIATDYVFRGVSQSGKQPALQGGIDLSYAVLPWATAYFGVWSSKVDFGPNFNGERIAGGEVDIYGGIKPTWGPATFDLGVIYSPIPAPVITARPSASPISRTTSSSRLASVAPSSRASTS